LVNNLISTLFISDSVTSIDYMAFNTNKLTDLIIPNSVISIGKNVFINNELINITMPIIFKDSIGHFFW
jgi:hypothetical protein